MKSTTLVLMTLGLNALAFAIPDRAAAEGYKCSDLSGRFSSWLPESEGRTARSGGDFELIFSGSKTVEIRLRLTAETVKHTRRSSQVAFDERIRIDPRESDIRQVDRAIQLLDEAAIVSNQFQIRSKQTYRSPSLIPVSVLDCARQFLDDAETQAKRRVVAAPAVKFEPLVPADQMSNLLARRIAIRSAKAGDSTGQPVPFAPSPPFPGASSAR